MNIKLTDKEFQKLAEDTGVSEYDLQKLHSMGMLKETIMLDHLICHDFNKVKRMDKYRTSQIITRLAMFYHVSKDRIANAINRKRVAPCYCEKCGKLIRKAEYNRNGGLCDGCVVASIELP